jgi:hypothetical protein
MCNVARKSISVTDICGHIDNATKFLTCVHFAFIMNKFSGRLRSADYDGQFFISEGRSMQLTSSSIHTAWPSFKVSAAQFA